VEIGYKFPQCKYVLNIFMSFSLDLTDEQLYRLC